MRLSELALRDCDRQLALHQSCIAGKRLCKFLSQANYLLCFPDHCHIRSRRNLTEMFIHWLRDFYCVTTFTYHWFKTIKYLAWIPLTAWNCPNPELFRSTFSRIRTEYGEILRISRNSVRTRENADQNNSEYGNFLRSDYQHRHTILQLLLHQHFRHRV